MKEKGGGEIISNQQPHIKINTQDCNNVCPHQQRALPILKLISYILSDALDII